MTVSSPSKLGVKQNGRENAGSDQKNLQGRGVEEDRSWRLLLLAEGGTGV